MLRACQVLLALCLPEVHTSYVANVHRHRPRLVARTGHSARGPPILLSANSSAWPDEDREVSEPQADSTKLEGTSWGAPLEASVPNMPSRGGLTEQPSNVTTTIELTNTLLSVQNRFTGIGQMMLLAATFPAMLVLSGVLGALVGAGLMAAPRAVRAVPGGAFWLMSAVLRDMQLLASICIPMLSAARQAGWAMVEASVAGTSAVAQCLPIVGSTIHSTIHSMLAAVWASVVHVTLTLVPAVASAIVSSLATLTTIFGEGSRTLAVAAWALVVQYTALSASVFTSFGARAGSLIASTASTGTQLVACHVPALAGVLSGGAVAAVSSLVSIVLTIGSMVGRGGQQVYTYFLRGGATIFGKGIINPACDVWASIASPLQQLPSAAPGAALDGAARLGSVLAGGLVLLSTIATSLLRVVLDAAHELTFATTRLLALTFDVWTNIASPFQELLSAAPGAALDGAARFGSVLAGGLVLLSTIATSLLRLVLGAALEITFATTRLLAGTWEFLARITADVIMTAAQGTLAMRTMLVSMLPATRVTEQIGKVTTSLPAVSSSANKWVRFGGATIALLVVGVLFTELQVLWDSHKGRTTRENVRALRDWAQRENERTTQFRRRALPDQPTSMPQMQTPAPFIPQPPNDVQLQARASDLPSRPPFNPSGNVQIPRDRMAAPRGRGGAAWRADPQSLQFQAKAAAIRTGPARAAPTISFASTKYNQESDATASASTQDPPPPPLPEGWKALQDARGWTYYYEEASGTMTWTPPR